MKQRTKVVARTFISVAGAVTVGTLLQGCPEQPAMQCTLTRGPFSARYDVVEKTGSCEDVAEIPADIIFVEQYFAEKGGRKPHLDKPSVALQALSMGANVLGGRSDPNPDHK